MTARNRAAQLFSLTVAFAVAAGRFLMVVMG